MPTITQKLIARYGNPQNNSKNKTNQATFEKKWMVVWEYPADIAEAIPSLGKTLYCNKELIPYLEKFYRELIKRQLHKEITSQDQCFCVRLIRGSETELSVHSFGMAIDLNPDDNPLGLDRDQAKAKGLKPFSPAFQQCAQDCGLLPGYSFKRKDGMHYEATLKFYAQK
jgi:hypothetical protein